MKKFLLVLTSVALLYTSCKKDDDKDNNDPSAITKENLSGSYTLVSLKAKMGILEQDVTNQEQVLPACKKDDILTLKSDMTLTSTDAGVTCPTNGNFSGTWSLSPSDSTITIEGETSKITKFDGKDLQLSYITAVPPFGDVTVLANFRKQ